MSLSLSTEQLTYIYETLHDRKTMKKLFKETRQQKKLCSKVMSLIEEEVLVKQNEKKEEA